MNYERKHKDNLSYKVLVIGVDLWEGGVNSLIWSLIFIRN